MYKDTEDKTSDDNAAPSTAPEAEVKPEGQTEASAAETPKKSNRFQERINQLTDKNHKTNLENVDLKKRLEVAESKVSEAPKPVPAAPKEHDFESDAAFNDANAQHIADLASNAAYDRISEVNKERDTKTETEQRNKELLAKQTTFKENVESKRENFSDFEDVAYGHQFMDQDLAQQIYEMDNGPEVAYYIGSHLDVAEKIFVLNPVQRARELTKLEMSVEALKPKKVSDAPDPITPLGSAEKVGKSLADLSDNEFLEARYAQLNARNNPQ